MKSERAAFFDEAIVSGPGQKEFEERIYAESQAKHWPRVPEGTGKFDGQVAIVTGAAGGQGEIEAKMFAQQGAKVYMVDVVEEGLKRVEANILADGGEAVAVVMDVADEEGGRISSLASRRSAAASMFSSTTPASARTAAFSLRLASRSSASWTSTAGACSTACTTARPPSSNPAAARL